MQQHVFNGTIWVPVTDEEHRASSLAHDVTTLDGFPGGGTTFLRDDGVFAAPSFTAAYYSGHDATDLAWGSTTWSGVHNALTITDVDQEGITRTDSTWTFAAAGDYVIHFASPALRTVTASIGIRARLSGVTVAGPMQSTTNDAGRTTIARLHKRLTLGAGAELTIEYCVTSAMASIAAASLDGETGHTCDIEMYRIR